MKSIKGMFAGAVAVALLGLSNLACASIVGDTVNVTHYYPDFGAAAENLGNQVVPTAAFSYDGYYSLVVDGSDLVYSSSASGYIWNSASFNGPVLTDLSATFTNAYIDATSTYTGFDASRLTFDANHIYLNLSGLNLPGYLKIDFETASKVPEPASLALFGLGLLGFAAARRKSRN